MRRLHGRHLSMALATTLTVANIGALMPMTAFAAAPTVDKLTVDKAAGFGGQTVSVTYTGDTVLGATESVQIVIKDDGGTGSTIASNSVVSNANANTAVGTITLGNTKSGTVTLALKYDSDTSNNDNEIEEIATAEITVTKAEQASTPVAISGTVKYLPAESLAEDTNTTAAELKLTATESFNYKGAAEDIIWKIYDSEGNEATGFTVTDVPETAWASLGDDATSNTEVATIVDADDNTDVDAGVYTVKAYTTAGTTEKAAEYTFTVVKNSTLGYSVEDKAGNTVSDYVSGTTPKDLAIDDTYKLLMYDGSDLVDNSKLTWGVVTGDEDYISIDSTGTIKAKKAGTGKAVEVSYKLNDDISYKISPAFKVDVAADTYAVELADASIEIGESTSAVLKLGNKTVSSGVTWSSSDESVATVDSSGKITALKSGTIDIKASFKNSSGTAETKTASLNVNAISYIFSIDGNAGTSASVYDGDSVQLSVRSSNGTPVGNITWKSSNKNVASVNSSGLVTVEDDASTLAPNNTANITAYDSDGQPLGSVTITALGNEYVINGGTSAKLYYGDTLDLVVTNGNDEVSGGIFKVTSGSSITITGRTVKVTSTTPGDQIVSYWADASADTTSDPADATLTITVAADEFNATLKTTAKTERKKVNADSSEAFAEIDSLEIGEKVTITLKLGSSDVTEDADWNVTSGEDYATVEGGVITAVKEGKGVVITGVYTINSTTYTVTLPIGYIITSTGAADSAEIASTKANEAVTAAENASDAAETATKAAETAKATPTAENLTKAEAALKTANDNLETAQAALEAAKSALAEAEAAGGDSKTAQAAVTAAETAVTEAEEEVKKAASAVADAQTTFDEAATEVEKAKKAAEEEKKQQEEQKAAEEKAAAQKEGATGTDATANANFTVTSTADKTVAYTAPATKAKKVTIPSTVTVGGEQFTVTEIAANAFKNDKTVTTITIPASVTKINSNAFKNAKNLKKINVKGAKLTTVKKNAFNGIKKNATIKVTGANKKANKKLLKKTTAVKKGNVKVK